MTVSHLFPLKAGEGRTTNLVQEGKEGNNSGMRNLEERALRWGSLFTGKTVVRNRERSGILYKVPSPLRRQNAGIFPISSKSCYLIN